MKQEFYYQIYDKISITFQVELEKILIYLNISSYYMAGDKSTINCKSALVQDLSLFLKTFEKLGGELSCFEKTQPKDGQYKFNYRIADSWPKIKRLL